MICNFTNWKFTLVIYVDSRFNCRSVGEGGELPPTLLGGSSLPFSSLLQLSREFSDALQED
jgi:hypothetical protein